MSTSLGDKFGGLHVKRYLPTEVVLSHDKKDKLPFFLLFQQNLGKKWPAGTRACRVTAGQQPPASGNQGIQAPSSYQKDCSMHQEKTIAS